MQAHLIRENQRDQRLSFSFPFPSLPCVPWATLFSGEPYLEAFADIFVNIPLAKPLPLAYFQIMAKQKRSPHAEFFVDIIGRKDNARNLLKKALPEDVRKHLDLESLIVEKGSYVDEDQRNHFSDLVFSVNLKNGESTKVYCLFEHKSTPEVMVSLQVLRYMVLEWNNILKQKDAIVRKLPPIIPIVVYQGHPGWNIGRDFHGIIDFPSDSFKTFIPDFKYLLWDFSGVDDKELQDALILRYYVLICKALGSDDLPDYLFELVEAFYRTLGSRSAIEYIEIFFRYIAKSSEKVSRQDFENALKKLPHGGERVMNTLAEQWMQEGAQRVLKKKDQWINEGELKARHELLAKTLNSRFDVVKPNIVQSINSLQEVEVLDYLFNMAFKASSIEEFETYLNEVK